MAAAVLVFVSAACGSSGAASPDAKSTSGGPRPQHYQLLSVLYAAESGTRPVIDPMTFTAAPEARAGVGPLSVKHVAGVAPAKVTAPPSTPLLGADGTSLKITLGQWRRAAGTVVFNCVQSRRRATSTLTGLLPGATYSVFVVHTAFDGPRRFTPWGNAAGTSNDFKASAAGTARPTDSLPGCSGNADDIVIVWHSDGLTHGKSPGQIGVNWHTSLIARVP